VDERARNEWTSSDWECALGAEGEEPEGALGQGGRRRRRYPKPGELSYDGLHCRLRAERGRPAEHGCADCGQPATDWSYDNDDPRELTDRKTGCAYSLDLARYLPRCRGCHRRVDWARRNAGRPPLDPQACLMHYRDGLGVKTIARMFGHPPAVVRAVLLEQGEEIRAHSAPLGRQRSTR
jgi:hypothetical protein